MQPSVKNINLKRPVIILSSIVALMSIPLVLSYSNIINWTSGDFILMAAMLGAAGLVMEYILRIERPVLKMILCIGLLAIFLLVWAELSVGIFGSPFAGS